MIQLIHIMDGGKQDIILLQILIDDWMSAEEVIIYSSNIGMAQLAQKLNEIEYNTQFIEGNFYAGNKIYIEYDGGFIEISNDIKLATLHLAKALIEIAITNIGK